MDSRSSAPGSQSEPPAGFTVERSAVNIIYTVLLAFALGFFIRSRVAAVALYLAGGAFVFAFQSVNLLVEWVGGSKSAFGGPHPHYESSKIFGYGLLNLTITLGGVGLVILGAKVAAKRAEKERSLAEVVGQ